MMEVYQQANERVKAGYSRRRGSYPESVTGERFSHGGAHEYRSGRHRPEDITTLLPPAVPRAEFLAEGKVSSRDESNVNQAFD
jgi:hypothetical protein